MKIHHSLLAALLLSAPLSSAAAALPVGSVQIQADADNGNLNSLIAAYSKMVGEQKAGQWDEKKQGSYAEAERQLRQKITQTALDLNSEDALRQAVKAIGESGQAVDEDLLIAFDDAAYQNVVAARNADRCRAYLKEFPYGDHRKAVADMIDELQADALPQTVDACTEWLTTHASSPSAAKVRERRETLAYDALSQQPTIAKVRQFLTAYAATDSRRQQAIALLPALCAQPSATWDELNWTRETYGFGQTAEGVQAERIYQSIITSDAFFRNQGFSRLAKKVTAEEDGSQTTWLFNAQGLLTSKTTAAKTTSRSFAFSEENGWTSTDERKLADGNYSLTTDDGATEIYEAWQLRKRQLTNGDEYQYEYNDHGFLRRANRYVAGYFKDNESFEYEYNADGDRTAAIRYDDKGVELGRTRFSYDYFE